MKKARLFVLAFTVLVVAFFIGATTVTANEGTVYITFEGFTLGHDFYLAQRVVRIEGETVMDLTQRVLTDAGFEFSLTAWGGLDRIYNIHPGITPNLPWFITITLEDGAEDGSLGSFDYTPEAGWMFSVNHFMPEVSADEVVLNDGDVVRWMFTIEGWGADLGLTEAQGFWMQPPYEHADKSALVRAIFPDEMDAYVGAKIALLNNPTATQEEVDYALNRRISLLPVVPITDWINPFTDVTENDWFYNYVREVFNRGLMQGISANSFAPDMPLSVEMAITLLWRYAGSPVVQTDGTAWYSVALAWAQLNDIDTTLFTEREITRAQAAQILMNV